MFFLTPTLDLHLLLLINQEWRLALFDVIMPLLSSRALLFFLLIPALGYAVFRHGKRQFLYFFILL
ncbi:MAG: phosphatase PAP2 family protein, partial [Pseudodesulfovibrio sp.]